MRFSEKLSILFKEGGTQPMDFTNFSLIYPDEASLKAHYAGQDRPNITMFELEELGMLDILELHSSELSEFFTTDPAVMEYRMDVFEDMLSHEEIARTLNHLIPVLNDIMELRRLEADSGDANSYLSSITEIELYISSIDVLHDGFVKSAPVLKSGQRLLPGAEQKAGRADKPCAGNQKCNHWRQFGRTASPRGSRCAFDQLRIF